MNQTVEPDPSMIGGVDEAVFALLPRPMTLFQTRAKRFAFLAESSELKPYLAFLAELTRLQARLLVQLPPLKPLMSADIARAKAAKMPLIDRAALVDDPELIMTLAALTEEAAQLEMPEPARIALNAVRSALESDRRWLLGNVLSDTIPEDSTAPHLFTWAAVQLHMARLAANLDPADLQPVSVGVCPSCGGRPAVSAVKSDDKIENVRYCTCATCATQWNEVRVKCMCCGSTKGISYRSAETHEATVKAECCSECNSWVKILYQNKNPSLEPMADDVGSLGLDMMMKQSPFKRAGFNPLMVGY